MAQYITLGFNIASAVIIVFGALWGLIRGLKRTASRALFLLVVTILLIFITIPITKLLLKIPVEYTTIDSNGLETSTKLPIIDVIADLIKQLIGASFVEKYPEFTNVIVSLPIILINAIIYLVLFWILKYLLYPIDFLIYKLTFGRKKKKKEAMGFADLDDEEHKIQPLNTEGNPFEDKDKKSKKNKKPEYPSSDKSIEPLREIYENSQKDDTQSQAVNNSDLFLKNNSNYDIPTSTAEQTAVTTNNSADTQANQLPKNKKTLVLDKDKKSDKYQYSEENNKPKKPKKHRLLGSLVGIAVGALVLFNTMIPIYGFMDILSDSKKLQLNHITEEEMSLSSMTNGITDDVLKGYELSIIGRLSKVLAIDKVGLTGFDYITTQKVDGNSISLRKDVSSTIKTINSANKLIGQYKQYSEKGLENITQEELDSLLESANTLLNNTQEIQFVNALSHFILPIVVDMLETQDVKISNNEVLNDLIIATLKDIEEDTGIVFFDEVNAVVDIANYLNEQKLLIVLISGKTDTALPAIQSVDDNFSETLSNKLFAIKSIDKTLPDVLNLGIQLFDDIINFGYVEEEDKNTHTQAEIKESFVQLIDNVISTAQSMDGSSPILLSYDSFVPLGKTLNTLRNSKLFNLPTYNKLVNFACNQLKGILTSAIPENLQASVADKILNNIDDVQDWELEMTIWSEAFNILRDKESGFLGAVVEGKDLRQGYSTNLSLNETTLSTIGKCLDKLETTTLLKTETDIRINSNDENSYKGTTLVHLFSSLLNELNDQAKSSIEEDSPFNNIIDIISTMRINLITEKHLYSANSTFWQDEISTVTPLFVEIYNMLESESFELSSDLGKHLDDSAKNSVMLGGDATWKLMSNALDLVKDTAIDSISNGELKTSITDIFNEISDNLSNPTYIAQCRSQLEATPEPGTNKGKYWQVELDYLMSLANIADKASSITTISGAQDIALDLDTVYQTSLISDATINSSIAIVLEQLKSGATSGIDGAINNTIDSIANDLKNNNVSITDNFWQTELNNIDEIMSIDFGSIKIKNPTSSDTTLQQLGAKFDNISQSSQFITHNRIRDILSSSINPEETDSVSSTIIDNFSDEKIKQIISTALTSISNNIGNTDNEIDSFQKELGFLQTLANINVTSNIITESSSENMNDLINLGKYLDQMAYNIKADETDYIVYDEDSNSKWITRQVISQLIVDMFNMSRDETVDNSNQQAVAYANLLTSIITSIEEKGTKYVYQWQTELKFVGHLLDLKNTTLQTSNIGKPLDAIAFNIYNNSATTTAYADIQYDGVDTNSDSIIDYYRAVSYPINGESLLDYTNETAIVTNSIFLSREILRDNVKNIFNNFKEDGVLENEISVDAIKNDLLDNLSENINISHSPVSNGSKFNTFTVAFGALEDLKTGLTDFYDLVDGKALNDIGTITGQIDETLETNQENILYGVVTTRKLALLITNEVLELFELLDSNDYSSKGYLEDLQSYYTNNLNSLTKESYNSTTSSIDDYDTPFQTYHTKYQEDLANLGL